jgi:hypothetical protein
MQRANMDANASLALNNKTRLYYHILSLRILLAVRDTVYCYYYYLLLLLLTFHAAQPRIDIWIWN